MMEERKVWFITGASKGLGLSIVKAALLMGDKVIATVRQGSEGLNLGYSTDQLYILKLDVTNEQQVKAATAKALDKFGRIDVLVNNAGVGLLAGVEEASAKEVFDNFNTNVFGLLNVIRNILPYMRGARSGHIINIASIGGLDAYPGWAIYDAAKNAVIGITEGLSKEMDQFGIKATVVIPGLFRTGFLDKSSLVRGAKPIEDYSNTVGQMRWLTTATNHKQSGDPDKFACAITKIAYSHKPPVHLLLGADALDRYRTKAIKMDYMVEQWLPVTMDTAFDLELPLTDSSHSQTDSETSQYNLN
ncbi:SDR family NAD(P)-dependent oxidoreductase [Limibacter armeniacum]|uniref:SDR family NAD(P)-dependent oxidoreductase n=1 Tax=Limibacter armeniacum TaxID=466084 RepID=UPI002FE53BC7